MVRQTPCNLSPAAVAYTLPVHRDAGHPAQDGQRLYALVGCRKTSLPRGLSIMHTQRGLLYRILIAGVLTPLGAWSSGPFWRNGSGTHRPGIGTCAASHTHARDGICSRPGGGACSCHRAGMRLEAHPSGSGWASEIRPSFFSWRLSRFSFSPAPGWDAALSRRSSTLSTRARDVSAMARMPGTVSCA